MATEVMISQSHVSQVPSRKSSKESRLSGLLHPGGSELMNWCMSAQCPKQYQVQSHKTFQRSSIVLLVAANQEKEKNG